MATAIDAPRTGRLRRSLKKYWKIWRISLTERLVYRADFMVSTFFRFLPLFTTLLLWQAVYEGAGKRESGEISGYTHADIVAYLLLVQISRMFSSMPGLAGGIARDIRDGNLKKYLLQPINMVAYLLTYRIAHKMAYMLAVALPYGVLFFLFREYLPALPDPLTLVAYFTALILGFLMGFFFESMVGMVGFWFLEVTSFLYVINTLNFFLSGHMFPIDLLPAELAFVMKSLPFQYLAYFPATIMLGKVQGAELVRGLLTEVAWLTVFIVMTRFFYRRGLRRYSAYGG